MFRIFSLVSTVFILLPVIVGVGVVQEESLELSDILAIIQDMSGEDVIVTQLSYNEDFSCWAYELLDGGQGCISDSTGELVDTSDQETTDEPDDEASAVDDETSAADDEASEVDDEASAVDDEASAADDEASEGSEVDDDSTEILPAFSIEDALAKALDIFPNSVVSGLSLEFDDDGNLAWNISLDDGDRLVVVDATTGFVLFFGFTSELDDFDEGSQVNSPDDTSNDEASQHDDEVSEPSEASEASEASEGSD